MQILNPNLAKNRYRPKKKFFNLPLLKHLSSIVPKTVSFLGFRVVTPRLPSFYGGSAKTHKASPPLRPHDFPFETEWPIDWPSFQGCSTPPLCSSRLRLSPPVSVCHALEVVDSGLSPLSLFPFFPSVLFQAVGVECLLGNSSFDEAFVFFRWFFLVIF